MSSQSERSDSAPLERDLAEDYIAERLEAIRWELADLNDLADSHELEGLPRLIHAVAQDVYRAEQWCRR